MIHDGGIVAIKGIGGFHLCCDATNEETVSRLRMLKHRPAKPFAVMAKDETVVKRECIVTLEQEQILTGHQKPILLLDRRSARIAAHRLRIVTPCLRIVIFLRTIRTHRKLLHAGTLSVVRQ